MAAKNRKTNTAKKSLSRKPKLAIWMGVLLVAIIAVVGLVVLRFSQASDNRTIALRPSDPNTQVCTFNGNIQALHLCNGEFADTSDGKAWRTSVNKLNTYNWFGPYEKLTAWPDGTDQKITACVTYRDNFAVLKQFNPAYNIPTTFVLDISTNYGTKVLKEQTITGQQNALKTTNNGLTVQCITADIKAQSFPADYEKVEYRVRVLTGSIDIFTMARTLSGTVTSSYAPTANTQAGMIWPVNPSVAQMRGPNSPGGSGCYGAPRANGGRHAGVDLLGTGNLRVENGNVYNDVIDVVAAQAGTVVNINQPNSDPGGYGNFIIIKHNDNLYTLYGHLGAISVGVGQQVQKGQVIGKTGEAGNAGPIRAGFVHTGNQVHFQVQNAYTGSATVPFTNTIDPSSLISQPINRNGC